MVLHLNAEPSSLEQLTIDGAETRSMFSYVLIAPNGHHVCMGSPLACAGTLVINNPHITLSYLLLEGWRIKKV